MTMGELSENLQYFLKLQKQRSKQIEKKNILDPLLSNFIFCSFFAHFFKILNNLKSYGSIN